MFDECEMECRALPDCVGYNFHAWGHDQGRCELLATMCDVTDVNVDVYVFDKMCMFPLRITL